MSSFFWILIACTAGGLLSVLLAALLSLGASARHVTLLVSFAVGALLGAVFLEILPYAFARTAEASTVTAQLLGGILLFFMLEKLVLWRHSHNHNHDPNAIIVAAEHDHGRSGSLILIGDTFHNFVDGVLIAAAFAGDFQVGLITALAIVAHEIPQELSSFLILLHSGFTRRRALLYNLLSGLAMLLGGVLAWTAHESLQAWVPSMVAIAAASMLYVAVADLIPGLQRRLQLAETLQQMTLIGLGVGSIWLVGSLLGHTVQ